MPSRKTYLDSNRSSIESVVVGNRTRRILKAKTVSSRLSYTKYRCRLLCEIAEEVPRNELSEIKRLFDESVDNYLNTLCDVIVFCGENGDYEEQTKASNDYESVDIEVNEVYDKYNDYYERLMLRIKLEEINVEYTESSKNSYIGLWIIYSTTAIRNLTAPISSYNVGSTLAVTPPIDAVRDTAMTPPCDAFRVTAVTPPPGEAVRRVTAVTPPPSEAVRRVTAVTTPPSEAVRRVAALTTPPSVSVRVTVITTLSSDAVRCKTATTALEVLQYDGHLFFCIWHRWRQKRELCTEHCPSMRGRMDRRHLYIFVS